jgi:hypothetical protein
MGTTIASVTKKLNEEGGYVAGDYSIHGDIYMDIEAEGNTIAEVTKELKGEKMHVNIKIHDGAGNMLEQLNLVKDPKDYSELILLNTKESKDTIETGLMDDRSQSASDDTLMLPENFKSFHTVQKTTENAYRIISNNAVTDTIFIISVNKENGNLYVETNHRKIELGIDPDVISKKAQEQDGMNYVGHIYLRSSLEKDIEYAVEGTKKVSVFGLLNLDIPLILHYDALTGEKITKENSLIDRLFFGFFTREVPEEQ